MLTKLPAYQINEEGAVKEWTTPLLTDNDAHRHCSHLYALYNGLPDEIASDPPCATLESPRETPGCPPQGIRRAKSPESRPPGEMAFGIVDTAPPPPRAMRPEMAAENPT